MADLRIHNMFMAWKRPDYVKSGLKLWLDGVLNTRHGHDASATGWEDSTRTPRIASQCHHQHSHNGS